MKRTPIRRVSPKQRAELTERRKLKQALMAEYGCCMTCGTTGGLARAVLVAYNPSG